VILLSFFFNFVILLFAKQGQIHKGQGRNCNDIQVSKGKTTKLKNKGKNTFALQSKGNKCYGSGTGPRPGPTIVACEQ
jgi:hypothetical protein